MLDNREPLIKQAQLARAVFAGEKKAPDTFKDGMFTGYASTWTKTPDAYGDTVVRGAFKGTLEKWKENSAPIPVLYGHDTTNPMNNIGAVVDVVEDEYGLKVTCELDIEDNPVSAQVWRLMKARRLREMSFAYFVNDGEPNQHGGLDLKDVDLLEVSVVMVGANRTALVDTPKNADTIQNDTVTGATPETGSETTVNNDSIETSDGEIASVPSSLSVPSDDTIEYMGEEVPAEEACPSAGTSDTMEGEASSAVDDGTLPNATSAGGVGGGLDATARARLTLLELHLRSKARK